MNTRKLTILLLDDKNGISEAAWTELVPTVDNDILDVVVEVGGRYFLNEDDAERLLESNIPECHLTSESISADAAPVFMGWVWGA